MRERERGNERRQRERAAFEEIELDIYSERKERDSVKTQKETE